jgi:hypothetical protein
MTTQIKLTDDLLSRIEHAISFFNQCRPREGFSVEERNAIRALRDITMAVCESTLKSVEVVPRDVWIDVNRLADLLPD